MIKLNKRIFENENVLFKKKKSNWTLSFFIKVTFSLKITDCYEMYCNLQIDIFWKNIPMEISSQFHYVYALQSSNLHLHYFEEKRKKGTFKHAAFYLVLFQFLNISEKDKIIPTVIQMQSRLEWLIQ